MRVSAKREAASEVRTRANNALCSRVMEVTVGGGVEIVNSGRGHFSHVTTCISPEMSIFTTLHISVLRNVTA